MTEFQRMVATVIIFLCLAAVIFMRKGGDDE
jgi:hypothetical protein